MQIRRSRHRDKHGHPISYRVLIHGRMVDTIVAHTYKSARTQARERYGIAATVDRANRS